MARFLQGIFGKAKATSPPATALRIQTSLQGVPIPILVGGQQRMGSNLIQYFGFQQTKSSSSGGGKGGVSGAMGKGQTAGQTYTTSMILAICEGPVTSIDEVYINGAPIGLPGLFGFTTFNGDYSQVAWGSAPAGAQFSYRGIAYMAAANYALGNSPSLPTFNWEVQSPNFFNCFNVSSVDADPAACIVAWLTNSHWGVEFPSARLDTSLTLYSSYCRALGLVVSPVVASPIVAAAFLNDLLLATNSDARWSSGILSVVPRGDQPISNANGTYTPNVSPIYDLTLDDFMPNSGSIGSGLSSGGAPLIVVRKPRSQMLNNIKVEYLNRANSYNPDNIEYKDEASIVQFNRERPSSVRQHHFFCVQSAATQSAQLQLIREQIARTYQFTVGKQFILLDPCDLVTVTDSGQGLSRQLVKITEIQENSDSSLTMTCEDFPGTASAPLYNAQANTGYSPNFNVDPGDVNPPTLFEPPEILSQGLEVWGGVSGINTALWGGCWVWVSNDDLSFTRLDTPIIGADRMGVLSAILPTFVTTLSPAIDITNTLSVNLTESAGVLNSVSQATAINLGTVCYVDGEYISYETATLTATSKYDLTYLVRGAYSSTIGAHAIGTKFLRLDPGIFRIPFTTEQIGTTIYIKFQSFNIWEGGLQSLADVGSFPYVIQGSALSSPPGDVKNFVFSYVGNITYMDWDNVSDPRTPVLYEIRKGATWGGGQVIGTYLHPHIPAFGDAIYFIKSKVQPITGLTVYSTNASEVNLSGSVIPQNLLASYDEGPSGANWPGFLSGSVVNDGITIHTIPVNANPDFLLIPDVFALADKFTVGSSGQGFYTIPSSSIVSAGRNAPCLVQIIWGANGIFANSDFFAPADFFNQTDIFGSDANQFIDVHPEISISTDGLNFGPWQKYQAGFYNGWLFNARMSLTSFDPTVNAALTSFVFAVYAPTRVDHPLVSAAIPAGGTTVVFAPDGATAAAFNGGPNGGTTSPGSGIIIPAPSLPGTQVTIINPQAGDIALVSGLSLSQASFQVTNGGVGVSRSITAQVWGF